MSPRPLLAAVALLTLAALPLAAQTPEPTDSLRPTGSRALSFSLPNGGGAGFGYWRVRSPRTSSGWFVSFNTHYQQQHTETGISDASSSDVSLGVAAGPMVRHYLETDGRVLPYLYGNGSLGFSYGRGGPSGGDRQTRHGLSLAAGLGVGAEWFPTRRVSISGETGLSGLAAYSWADNLTDRTRGWDLSLGTFRSALSLNLYFPSRRKR